ncbi:MAG: protein kinase [Thermoanaerobaculia bacterium]
MIGRTVSHFEITARLGKGGMGEVYRATDTKLGREVAIKVLPEALASDPERLARFDREARVLAALAHSKIAAIYGLEEAEGRQLLVMQLAEGETLAESITRGSIPVEKSIPIALQIAEALEAAHEKGIIHRDLKPANVKVTQDGQVKVLDFGLAKALEPESVSPAAESLSISPTLTAEMTRAGQILGTAAYMSPEQARGQEVDKRADIWAFGAVLYEMLTGRAPFPGSDVTEVLAAVIRAEPDWSKLPGRLHQRVRDLLERCLEKEPRNRCHDIADVRIDVERVLRDPDGSPAEPPGTVQRSSRGLAAWGAAAFALGAVLAGTTVWNLRPSAPNASRPVRFSFAVPESPSLQGGIRGRLAMSPDGTTAAYVGARLGGLERGSGDSGRLLYLRRIDAAEGRPIPGTAGAENLFFSPDGAWVGFVAEGRLQRVPVAGGAPLEICNAWMAFGGSWGPDDTIIFGGGISSGLMRVAVAGGQPQPLTSPDPARGEIHHGYPDILPDGRTVLFTIGTGDGSRIAKLSLDTGDWEELLPYGGNPRYISAGYLAFSEKGNLRLVRFDPKEGQVSGSVVPALDGIGWSNWAGEEGADFAVSRRGDLAFIPGRLWSFERNLVWVDRRGEETVIDVDPASYIGPRVSPDGRRIAVVRLGELGLGEIWVMNGDGGQAFPVATDGADYNPVWKPEGKALTYTSNGDMFEKPVDRDDPRVNLLRRDNYQFPRSWSPDGRLLAFLEFSSEGFRTWVMPRDGEPEPLLDASFNSVSPRFSPRGDWIAYVSDESGQEVYVRRYPGSQRGQQISMAGGREPVWSVDGRELFYRHGDRMMAVPITTEPEFEVGEPVELWETPYLSLGSFFTMYDVAPDGRFLMLKLPDTSNTEPARVHVVLDWLKGIEERMQASD